jgi:hypothetical protein
MAFTARIGMPEPKMPATKQQELAKGSNIAFRYVLQAAVLRNNAWQWLSIAIANTPEELNAYFKTWLTMNNNVERFSGQTRIELVPDISR